MSYKIGEFLFPPDVFERHPHYQVLIGRKLNQIVAHLSQTYIAVAGKSERTCEITKSSRYEFVNIAEILDLFIFFNRKDGLVLKK